MKYRQVNLDFHTSECIENIGKKFDKKQFQDMLKIGHINSITLFSKCHHGWSYHPTKVNEMRPHLDFDLLGAQIGAAHEIGVKTPVYISAGCDEKAFRAHEDWRYVGELNKKPIMPDLKTPLFHGLCFNTPYLDYLCAQVEEVISKYDADGLFVDISAPKICYCETCRKQIEREGNDPNDRRTLWELAQRVYMNYTRRIAEAAHKYKKDISIFHNGGHIIRGRYDVLNANGHIEIESLPTGGWGYDDMQISTRYVQPTKKDFLVMTGKFHIAWGEFGSYKTDNALLYEATLAAALGGKVSIGDQLHPNGKFDELTYKKIGKAYEYIEKIEPWLDNVDFLCNIGVFSAESYATEHKVIDYKEYGDYDIGVSRALNEGKYLYQFIDIESDFSKYKVIILPDIIKVSDKLRAKLNEFVRCGGKLFATGKSGLKESESEFAFDFGIKYVGECEFEPTYADKIDSELNIESACYVMYEKCENISLCGGRELIKMYSPYFNRTIEHFCSHMHAPCSGEYLSPGMVEGNDGIYCAWRLFADYAHDGNTIYRNVICGALDMLLDNKKKIKTNLYRQGIVTLAKQKYNSGTRYVLHMLYASPVKRGKNIEVIEDLPEIYNTEFEINLADEDTDNIKRVYLAPQNKDIEYEYTDKTLKFKVDKFVCHQMVVIE